MSTQPIYLLADSQLLFWSDGRSPFTAAIRERIGTREPKAAYVGASNGDDPAYYSIFEAGMDRMDVRDRRLISSLFRDEDREYLSDADIILLAGGDVARGWRIMRQTGMCDLIRQRFEQGATLIGVSAGAVLLGLQGWTEQSSNEDFVFDSFGLLPWLIDAHDEERNWSRLRNRIELSAPRCSAIGLPAGSGMICHPDLTLEPVRRPVCEFNRNGATLTFRLLLPPQLSAR